MRLPGLAAPGQQRSSSYKTRMESTPASLLEQLKKPQQQAAWNRFAVKICSGAWYEAIPDRNTSNTSADD